jgi:ribosome-associated protein
VSEPQGVSRAQPAALPKNIRVVIETIDDLKATGLLVLDVREVASFTDYLVLCTGGSDRHVQAVVDGIKEKLRAIDVTPLHTEGYEQAAWVLVDFVDFLVNAFTAEARDFYQLERVWRDAPVLAGERPEMPSEDAGDGNEAGHDAGDTEPDGVDG